MQPTAGHRAGPDRRRQRPQVPLILLLLLAGLLSACGDDGAVGSRTATPASTSHGRASTADEITDLTEQRGAGDPTEDDLTEDDPVEDDLANLVSGVATLTWYTSYPEPGSDECIGYKGCEYAGQFAALPDVQDPAWVADTNIIAVHEKDFERFRLRTLLLRQGDREIEGVVYDKCADSDCAGCCTANLSDDGYLIDLELHTMERFGSDHGEVEWYCLDCPESTIGDP